MSTPWNWIDGAWIENVGDTIDVISPATRQPVGKRAETTAEDVDKAVADARRAFAGWPRNSLFVDLVDAHALWDGGSHEQGVTGLKNQIRRDIASRHTSTWRPARVIGSTCCRRSNTHSV